MLASPTSNPRTSRVVRKLRRNAESSSTISNRPCESSISGPLLYARQCEKESCTCFRIAINPHSAGVGFSNSFGYREPNAGSGRLMLSPGGTIEALKDPQPFFRCNVRPLILHFEHDLCIGRRDAEGDWRTGACI